MIKGVTMYKSYLVESENEAEMSMELGKAYDWASKSNSKILVERKIETCKALIVVMFPNEVALNTWKEVAMYKSYLVKSGNETEMSMELGKAYDWASKSNSKILVERKVETCKMLILVMFTNEVSLSMWEASVQVVN